MLQAVAKKVFGSKNERELKNLWPLVEMVNALEDDISKLDDSRLQDKTAEFKRRLDRGEPLDDILPEAFAVVRETSIRKLGMRHFDVQLLGGLVLHRGTIAEMKTGEGKTLCATLPVYLNALTGKGVHVVTVNDYLARRDAEWMATIYSFLGLETGVIVNGMTHEERLKAYRSDITYGQNNEFGFDYLRDNMKLELEEKVQRVHHYAIVDEVDSILIDEARTPLIISGASDNPTDTYYLADKVVRQLTEEEHFTIDLKSKQVMLTDEGVARLEEILELDNLYAPNHIEVVHHVNQSLKAHHTMKLDFDYVVREGEVVIVDEFTGRLMPGRRWSDGLHQSVEAKEGVPIARESQTLATITFQNYFRMYEKLAGMTGTADTEAVEFQKIYNLNVVIIPTNKPMIRADHADVVFATEHGKFNAAVEEIVECQNLGQPVLVGTASIARSETIGKLLAKRGVKHHVLNAKQHEREAEIVAQAGRLGAVTISTNMAGRGTDIVLGGNAEALAADEVGTRDPLSPEFQEALEHYQEVCAEEKEKVLAAGGLHIIGTERHESRRIDNQLRGRSGRQGDPGSSRFYVSLEDDLMRRFGGERMQAIMSRVGMTDEDAIEGALVGRAIENAQKKVEGYHFDIRKHLLEYDDVMNKQREVIYKQREEILKSEGVEGQIQEMIPDVIEDVVLIRASEKDPVESWDVEGMFEEFHRQFGVEFDSESYLSRQKDAGKEFAQEIYDEVKDDVFRRYEERKRHFGPDRMLKLERLVLLQAIDFYWKEHLSNIDHLKEGIGLRGYGQRNPLHEYQREAFELFTSMMMAIKSSVLQTVFVTELPSEQELEELEEHEKEMQRRREEAAKTVHEDVTEGGVETVDNSGLNRKQRRRQARDAKHYAPSESDYQPSAVQQPSGTSSKKAAQRKKNKAARKARKRGR